MYISSGHIIKPHLNHSQIMEVYHSLASLENDYPFFNYWFTQKVVNGIYNNERSILIKKVGSEIAGIAVLKNLSEKKISTLRVMDSFKGMGIGSELIEHSFEVLGTEKPMITVAASRYSEFEKVLNLYKFELCQSLPAFYKANEIEFCFNGNLVEDFNAVIA